MAQYQGHRSWNAWNVSLWINNDAGLYTMAHDFLIVHDKKEDAARAMRICLQSQGMPKTPDGAPYTVTSIREAMEGMLD